MERIIIRILTLSLIPIIVRGVLGYLRHPKQAEEGKVYFPKAFVVLGTIVSLVFLIPAIITAFSAGSIGLAITFLVLSSLGGSLIIAFVNCRITYDENGFVHKSFFGIKREYTYGQVTAIRENVNEKYIYVGKKKVMIDAFSIGGKDFVRLVKKKYRTLHDGQSLPKLARKRDVFNGNVKSVGEFYFVYTLIGAAAIAFLVLSVYITFFTPKTASNTVEQTVCFTACYTRDYELTLVSEDNKTYNVFYVKEMFNAKSIEAICDGEKVVTVYSQEVTPDKGEAYYSVGAIMYNGSYILSFDETNEMHVRDKVGLVFLSGALFLLWVALVIGSIIVGRNPRKFSKRFVRLFFKDGYIEY